MDAETLRDHARDVLTNECPSTRVTHHFVHQSGTDRDLWAKLVELGWSALALPEDDGGLGLGLGELCVLYEELGRAGAPVPFLSTQLSAQIIAQCASGKLRADWLERIAAGAIVALEEPGRDADALPECRFDGDHVQLTGSTGPIIDAADAEMVLVLARDIDGNLHRVVIEPETDGFAPKRIELYDRGHSVSTIALDGLGIPASRAMPATAEQDALAHYQIGLAAEAIGGCDALIAMTVEYLQTRTQFGRPIGSFQALKHRVADHAAALFAARILYDHTRDHLALGLPAFEDAAAAKALCCETFLTLSRDAIQLHGGIAFTAEHAAHVWVKHAWLIEALAGGREAAQTRATESLFNRPGANSDEENRPSAPQAPLSGSPIQHADDLDAFRQALRAWLPAAIPANYRQRIRDGGQDAANEVQREWHETLEQAGLAVAHWPSAWGGSDLSLEAQIVYYEEMVRADAPNSNLFVISLYHMPATLFAHGTPEQRDRYLQGVRRNGEVWAQGFSEPGAGSDLASLSTRAERKGDKYVLNGQKIWSSGGKHADFYLLLARTDPHAARKHDGISMFLVDLKNTPGITVREIEQITGDSEFAEVFMDDAEIPAENLIGEENKGWMIAQSTLTTERGLLIFEHTERLAQAYERDARQAREDWLADPAKASQFRAFFPRIRAVQLLARRLLDELAQDPHGGGATATYLKLAWGPLLQEYTMLIARMGGLKAQHYVEPLRCVGHNSGDAMYDFLLSYGWTIAGGSNEVMRNIVAERLLGLPKG